MADPDGSRLDVPKRTHARSTQPVAPRRCGVETCERPYHSTGYCRGHYTRVREHGDPRAHVPLRPLVDKGCLVDNCDGSHYGRGLCAAHWMRARTHGDLQAGQAKAIVNDDERRFWSKTRFMPSGCIKWNGRVNAHGYGEFGNRSGSQLAHRWYYELVHGSLDPKAHLDHYRYPQDGCIGPACILHVRPTTAQENTLRGDTVTAWNKAKTHCPQGHPYAGDNLVYERDGSRRCRKCRNASKRAGHYRRKSRSA